MGRQLILSPGYGVAADDLAAHCSADGRSGQKTVKMEFLRHNVATSLRRDVNSHMVHCAYIMSMSPSNLKQIRRKTRPKNGYNRRQPIYNNTPCLALDALDEVLPSRLGQLAIAVHRVPSRDQESRELSLATVGGLSGNAARK